MEDSGPMAKLKGTAIIPAVKLVRRNLAKMESVLSDGAKRLVSARIMPGSWYPMEDATELLEAICDFYGGSHAQSMEMVGMYCAEGDLNGVYAHLIVPGHPVRSFRRAIQLWRNYQDTGNLTFHQPSLHIPRATVRLEEFSQTIPYCACIVGMARVVARLAGVEHEFQIRETHCTLRGDPACEFESTWG